MIGLIDVDGTLPNMALMKISTYYKSLGETVEFVQPKVKYEKIYASAIFTRSRKKCEDLLAIYGDRIEIGGTGWDLEKKLPPEIESCKPDYDLYTTEMIYRRIRGILSREQKWKKADQIVKAGLGCTSRGCVRNCGFCLVPKSEGPFRQDAEISDIINPRSNVIILHDNNLTADPYCIDKLHELRDRKLIVDINQGCDVRLMTDEIAHAMKEVNHLRSVHYAWDLMGFENQVMQGIEVLTKYIKKQNQACFMLVGYDTTFEEDVYRFRKLIEMKIRPYVMVYDDKPDERLQHFKRWVNSMIFKACKFEEYKPWVKAQAQMIMG
ncbi:MAG TPA: radical SAM protein [Bacillota bacterium]|nr:radical SAM protein [Bacillota bacterium]